MTGIDSIIEKYNLPKGLKRYFFNTGWLFLEKVVRILTALVVGIYVARYLGPERFGILSYAISIVALFTAVSDLGLKGILVREFVNNKREDQVLLCTAFILKLTAALLIFAMFAAVLFFSQGERTTQLVILIIAAGLIFKSFNVIQFFFESQVLSKYYVHSQLIATIATGVITFIFIFLRLPLLYFSIAVAAESLILSTGLVSVYLKRFFRAKWTFKAQTALRLLRHSWPLILSGIAVTMYMKVDQVMIKNILDSEAVGQYAAAVRISEAWYFIPIVICNSLFPAIINAKKTDPQRYQQRIQLLYTLMIWISVPVALIVTLIAPWLVRHLFGQAYSDTARVLQVHIWAAIFVFLGIASSKYLLAENYTRITFVRTFVGMIVNVILNFILIDEYGIMGAAVATLVSYFISVFMIAAIPKTAKHTFFMVKAVAPLGFMKRMLTDRQ